MKLLFEDLTGTIRQTAYEIHCYFGPGFLEKVYENALAHRLRKLGFDVQQQTSLTVCDEDGVVVGDFTTDLMVDSRVMVEVKARGSLTDGHRAQLLNYLTATNTRVGLLINFGTQRLQCRRMISGTD